MLFKVRSWFTFSLLAILITTFSAVKALADGDPVILPPTSDELMALLNAIGGVKGASAMAIVAVVVQAVMLFFRSPLANFAGKWKLIIVLALSLVGGVVALMASGMGIVPALLHSTTLAAAQVLIHQVIKQLTEKPEVKA